jgi:NAD(P)-dependent dehydrogenase (short-subunit alcohol dehydrogenase family)
VTRIDFGGRRALVTGATSGIGRATATLLADSGATVLATGRDAAALDAITRPAGASAGSRAGASATSSSGSIAGSIAGLAGDLTADGFRHELVQAAVERLGGLDVLVNAAGILQSGDWRGTTLADWDRMLDINLRSLFALSQLAIPHLIESRGAIVNVSSVTGPRAFPNVLAYCVSKAGLDQLTRCLALELAPHGVRVNAVNPGVVRTNLHRTGGMPEERYSAFLEHSKTTHPLGRVGEPADVAHLIAFLASDSAGWITGETIAVDGGRAQTCAR